MLKLIFLITRRAKTLFMITTSGMHRLPLKGGSATQTGVTESSCLQFPPDGDDGNSHSVRERTLNQEGHYALAPLAADQRAF